MNYGPDGYVMGNLVLAALKKKRPQLQLDLLTGASSPKELLVPGVARSIRWYHAGFPGLVDRSGSSMSFVASASLVITLDLASKRNSRLEPSVPEVPFVCLSRITDNQGKTYSAEIKGWWFAET
jgi:hypothetical protein